jgi:hypothetical protein
VSDQTTEGVFRVLESTRDREEWLLLDVGTADPTYVSREGYEGALGRDVDAVEPGNRVRAELEWDDGEPRFVALEVLERTRFAFTRTREGLFQDAIRAWNEAERAGEAMNARVTRGQDGTPNGVVYVFADQPGERDLFAEFRDGLKPVEPLLGRLAGAERAEPPFEAFVIDNTDAPFLVVLLCAERDGLLASTVRETYFGGSLFAPSGDPGGDLDLDLDVAGEDVEFDTEGGADTDREP